MRTHDLPLPPPASPKTRTTRASSSTTRPQIQYPADGATFYIDPVLRRTYQTIRLRGTVPDGVTGAHWVVDGTRHAPADAPARWTLTPGTHRLVLRGHRNGRSVESAPVRLRVVSAEDPPARSKR